MPRRSLVSERARFGRTGEKRGTAEVKLVYGDSRQAFSGGLIAFGPLLPFAAVRMPAFAAARLPAPARGQVTGRLVGNPAVRASPAHMRLRPRAVAAPPFSGPRSRGTTEAHNAQPRHHGPSARRARTPRMGPAPGGTTTALLPPVVAGAAQGCTPVARAGGSGYGRRTHSRCPGSSCAWLVLMELRAVEHIRCSASVGRRTYPGPPALAAEQAGAQRPTLACAQRQPPICTQRRTAAKGRNQPFTPQRRFMRRGSRETPVEQLK